MVAEFERIPTDSSGGYDTELTLNPSHRRLTMSAHSLPSTCPDCGGSFRKITLFGRGMQNPVSGAAHDAAVVHYAAAQARRGFWLGMFDAEGTIDALLCGECSRVFLYASPYADAESAAAGDALHCLECGTLMQPDQQRCPSCGWTYSGETL